MCNNGFLVWFFIALFSHPLFAAEKQKFPDSLFGVKLGGVYKIGEGKDHSDVGNLPVKKFAGMEKGILIGAGFHYYFEPLKAYKAFRYVEKRKKPSDEFFPTSFVLYLFPVIPKIVKSLEEFENISDKDVNWEVASIRWQDDATSEKDAYAWAASMCKNISVDLGRESDHKLWEQGCSFVEDTKELDVEAIGELKLLTLRYTGVELGRKNEAIINLFRKWEMNDIRPYNR